MSEKIAVWCPTEELWEKAQEKAFGEGLSWYSGGNTYYDGWGKSEVESCILVDYQDNDLTCQDVSYFKSKGYTIIPAEEWLRERTEKLHPLEYSVPLRVGDGVRVVGGDWLEVGDIGKIVKRDNSTSNMTCNVETDSSTLWLEPQHLELIPTEADITVGSVWEGKDGCAWGKGEIFTVTGFDHSDDPVGSNNLAARYKHDLLEDYKLIHRGDGGEKKVITYPRQIGKSYQTIVTGHTGDSYAIDLVLTDETKTNKKEKKMKRAEKVIKVGMIVMDRDCRNAGKVEAIYEKQSTVTYTDQSDYTIHTVDIGRLYIPLEMPKPEPVKAKKKKPTKKKTTKKN